MICYHRLNITGTTLQTIEIGCNQQLKELEKLAFC